MDIRLRVKKKYLIFMMLIALVGGGGYYTYANKTNANPLPSSLQNQISFKTIYPSDTGMIDGDSIKYKSDTKVLSFAVNKDNNQIVFTQQQSPESLGDGNQVSYQALGLHPYAQFQTKLGSVALTKFWETGSLEPFGQTAFLVSNGTMLNAHSSKNISNSQWKDLLENLEITQ